MHTVLRTLRGASTVALAALLGTVALVAAAPALPAGASGSGALPALPQVPAAQGTAAWLAGQLTPGGYIPGSSPGSADLSGTVNTVLALAAANTDLPAARSGLSYLAANSAAYITQDGNDGPGQLALLILAAHAMGTDPTNFGGTNLVARLLATEQTSGADAGLFGTESQVADFDAGAYDQGLALQALAAAGVAADAAAIGWLGPEQCPDGGWTFQNNAQSPCNTDPIDFGGPDTNTTSEVVQGLAAQGQLSPALRSGALSFFKTEEDPDAGWGYYPNASDAPEVSDPDSTGLVMQALLAMGLSPDNAAFVVGGASPTTELLSFRINSGAGAGAFTFPGSSGANLLATYEPVPALMGVSFPFGPFGREYWLVGSRGGVFSFGGAGFHGSEGNVTLNKPVVGMAPTPDGLGYWLAASDGGIFTFGDAGFHGSLGNKVLNKPVVGIAATPDGAGYWLVASDGGVFTFGDAQFHGSLGNKVLNKPVVGMAATPDGAGYWLVASDGGIFAFGDAGFYGSLGNKVLNKPVVGIAATPDGGGYWLVASDGGVFNLGDAGFFGSMGNTALNKPVVGLTITPDGGGYWLVASDGGVFNFGDATFGGSAVPYGVSDVVGALASAA
jgi:hypothetical protein